MRQNETSRADKTASKSRSSSANKRGVRAGNTKASRQQSTSKRARVKRRLEVAGPKRVLIACSVLFVAGLLGVILSKNLAEFRQYETQAAAKARQLQALQTQHDAMNRRLAFLQLPKGREQVLLEHGYLQPNDRILLFPQDQSASKRATQATTSSTRIQNKQDKTQNDTNSQPASMAGNDEARRGSFESAGNSVSRWWNDVNRATGSTPNATP